MDLSFLLALEVGESYAFDIPANPTEKRLKITRSARSSYITLSNALNKLEAENKHMKFVRRTGDWHDEKTRDKVFVYCIRKGDKTVEPPPKSSYVLSEMGKALRKKAKAAALQQELAKGPPPPAPSTPPHVRTMTVDDQLRLVELVQAAARGETIQLLHSEAGEWRDLKPEHINWKVPVNRLRLKPKPRRTVYLNNDTFKHTFDHEEAKKWASGYTPFREVFPEDEE